MHAHFHVLMLLFLAGMVGFCLTHDLFNLFVWFEVMSVAAFALTGYHAAQLGARGRAQLHRRQQPRRLPDARRHRADLRAGRARSISRRSRRGVARSAPAIRWSTAAFCLLAAGLLIKAAMVPFQFWLADAHAVAPSPVSVIFSGAMVSLGLFGLAKLIWPVFAPSAAVHAGGAHAAARPGRRQRGARRLDGAAAAAREADARLLDDLACRHHADRARRC